MAKEVGDKRINEASILLQQSLFGGAQLKSRADGAREYPVNWTPARPKAFWSQRLGRNRICDRAIKAEDEPCLVEAGPKHGKAPAVRNKATHAGAPELVHSTFGMTYKR